MKLTLEPGPPHPADQKRQPGDPRVAANIPVLPRIGGHLRGDGDSEPRTMEVARRAVPRLAGWLVAMVACACLTGCLGFLEPARPIARHFVLTPLPGAGPVKATPDALAVGVGPIKLPPYLYGTSLAVRKGTNEIDYLPWVLWSERLDKGIQRMLVANLSTLLAPDQIRLTAWRSEDVSAEVYVAIGRFDVDAGGQGVLIVWWRILAPGGEKTLKAGQSRFVRQGPSPDADPSGAVATLSALVGDFSRELAQAMKETMPAAQ